MTFADRTPSQRIASGKSWVYALGAWPLVAAALYAPAHAIDAVTAIDMCGRNPSCKSQINPADGWIDIFVGDDQVMCNPRGDQQCTCITCGKAAKGPATTKGPAATMGVGIPGIISGKPTRTPVVGIPKPRQATKPVQGLPRPVKKTKTRKPPVYGLPRPRHSTIRDHRGTDGAASGHQGR